MTLFRLHYTDGLYNKTLVLKSSNKFGVLEYESNTDEDRLVLTLLGNSASENVELLGQLEWFLDKVNLWTSNRLYPRTYLERDVTDSETNYYRTPIDNMQINLRENWYNWIHARKPEVEIKISHPAYWESSEVVLKISNPHVNQDTTDPIRVDNLTSNQGSSLGEFYSYLKYFYSSHLQEFQSQLSYPVKLRIKSLDSQPIDSILLSVGNQMSDNVQSNRVLDAYYGMGGTTKPSAPNYNLYQYGYYKELSVSTSWTSVIHWELSAPTNLEFDALLILARILNPNSDVRFGVRFGKDPAVFSEWLQAESHPEELCKIGILRSTLLHRVSNDYNEIYNLHLMAIASTSTSVDLDYLEIFPARDVVEVVSASGRGLQTGETLFVDGAIKRAWVTNSNNRIIDHWIIRGGGNLTLTPDRDGVVYFKMRGAGHILKRVEVQAFARSRTRA